MNERIEQLAEQADYSAPGGKWKEYFAELIVRECATIVEDSPWNLPQGYKAIDQANAVKKYFGVE